MVKIHRKIMPYIVYPCIIFCWSVILNTDAYPQKKEYPARPIEIIVATPGSLLDIYTRAWSEQLSRNLKTPVIINNKGGTLSQFIACSMAKPDGYTLASFSYPSLVGQAMSSKPPVDLFKDFVPIGGFGGTSTVIAVEKSSPFAKFEDLIDYAKKNPKKLKCGSPGIHVCDHFTFELVKESTGTDIVLVPYTGSSQVITALLGQHIDLLTLSPAALIGLMKAGRVRPLLTALKLRDFPDVPLFSEKGLTEAAIINWAGLMAPSAVPKEIQKKLIDAFEKAAKDQKIIEKIEQLAFTGDYLNPTEMAIQIKKDYEKIKTVVKRVGIGE